MNKMIQKALLAIGLGLVFANITWGITLELQNWDIPMTRMEHMNLGIKPFLCTGFPGLLMIAYIVFKGDLL